MTVSPPTALRRHGLTWIVLAATAGALLAIPFAAEAASAAPKCFGKVATIVGTNGADTINGTPGPDVIVARGGNDIINGRGGKDRICAGSGKDVVRAGLGHDLVNGGYGSDELYGYVGDDVLLGKEGNDIILGGDGSDHISGGPGVDKCHQNAGTGKMRKCEKADLAVVVTSPARSASGDVDFKVTVTNNGPSAVPYTLSLAQSSTKADCADPAWGGEHAGAWLAVGASRDMDVVASCTATAKGRAKVIVSAAVSSVAPDPDPLNDAFEAKTNLK